jgi:hypothetical protein
MKNENTEVVLSFIQALNNDNFAAARSCLNDNLRFEGVLGARDGAGAYMADMEKMKFKYDIKKVFTDDHDVCLWYDIDMGGKTVLCAGWYKVQHGKIEHFQVLFDPRPVL